MTFQDNRVFHPMPQRPSGQGNTSPIMTQSNRAVGAPPQIERPKPVVEVLSENEIFAQQHQRLNELEQEAIASSDLAESEKESIFSISRNKEIL